MDIEQKLDVKVAESHRQPIVDFKHLHTSKDVSDCSGHFELNDLLKGGGTHSFKDNSYPNNFGLTFFIVVKANAILLIFLLPSVLHCLHFCGYF